MRVRLRKECSDLALVVGLRLQLLLKLKDFLVGNEAEVVLCLLSKLLQNFDKLVAFGYQVGFVAIEWTQREAGVAWKKEPVIRV